MLVLNNVGLSQVINPYIYFLFILWLPLNIPAWLLILVSFATGICIDMFCNSPGVHAAATVLVGYLRPFVVNLLTPKNNYQSDDEPRIGYLGLMWFLAYAGTLIFFHHAFYFILEAFSFEQFFFTFQKIVFSFIMTFGLVVLTEYLFYSSGKKKR